MVSYQTLLTNNYTAVAGQDFQAVNGTLSFTPGSTAASFSVPLLDDNNVGEPNTESLHLSLSSPTGAVLGVPASAVLFLTEDNDPNTGPINALATSSTNCGCIDHSGDLVQTPPAATGPVVDESSPDPVRYADGVVTIAVTDLRSAGFGFPWAQTRSWTNGAGYAASGVNGVGWVDTYTPQLIEADGDDGNTLVVINNGTTVRYFDLVDGVYQARFDDPSQLSYNSGTDIYTLVDGDGDQITFSGFDGARRRRSAGSSPATRTRRRRQSIAVTSYTANGHIAEVQRSADNERRQHVHRIVRVQLTWAGDPNAGLLSNVTLRRKVNGGAWTMVQQVQYTYYDGTQTYGGNLGDLMTATVEDGGDNVLSDELLPLLHGRARRTATARSGIRGQPGLVRADDGGLRHGPEQPDRCPGGRLRRLLLPVRQHSVPQSAKRSVAGGGRTYTYSYTASTNSPGENSWATKTVVTQPGRQQRHGVHQRLRPGDARRPLRSDQRRDTDTFYAYNSRPDDPDGDSVGGDGLRRQLRRPAEFPERQSPISTPAAG